MMVGEKSAISWTDATFNPWIGCSKVSPGCAHCYAETLMDRRYGRVKWGMNGTRSKTSPSNWAQPVAWNRRAAITGRIKVFCASLADVFEDWSGAVLDHQGRQMVRADGSPMMLNDLRSALFRLWRETPFLDWLVLTKRPHKVAQSLPDDWGDGYPNVWLGTTVESFEYCGRLAELQENPAVIHFVSYEPAIGPLRISDFNKPPDWLICGAESGAGRRQMSAVWASDMLADCDHCGTFFFMKQMSIDGEITTDISQFPVGLQRQEFPLPRRSQHLATPAMF